MSPEKPTTLTAEFPEKPERVERAPKTVEELLKATAKMFQIVGLEFSVSVDTMLMLGQLEAVIDRYCSRDEKPTPLVEWLFEAVQVSKEDWSTHEMRPYVLRIVQHIVSEVNPILAELHDAAYWPRYTPEDLDSDDEARMEGALIEALSFGYVGREHVATVFAVLQELHTKDPEILALTTESPFTNTPLIIEHPFRSSRVDHWQTEIALQMRIHGGRALSGIPALVRDRHARIEEALLEQADIEEPDDDDRKLQSAIGHVVAWMELHDYSLHGVSDTDSHEFAEFSDIHMLEGSPEEVDQLLGSCLRIASECPILWMRIIGHDIAADYGVSGETNVGRSRFYGNALHVALYNALENVPTSMNPETYGQYRQLLRKLTIIDGEDLVAHAHMNAEFVDALGRGLPGVLENLVLGGEPGSLEVQRMSGNEKIVSAVMGAALMGPLLMNWMNSRTAAMLEAADTTLESNPVAAAVRAITEAKNSSNYSPLEQIFKGRIPQTGDWGDTEITLRQLHSRAVRGACAELVESIDAQGLPQLPREVFLLSPNIARDPVTLALATRFSTAAPLDIRSLLVTVFTLGTEYLNAIPQGSPLKVELQKRVPGNIEPHMRGDGGVHRKVENMLLNQARGRFRWSDMAVGMDANHLRALVDLSLWQRGEWNESSAYGAYLALSELAEALSAGDIMNANSAQAAILAHFSQVERVKPDIDWQAYRRVIESKIPANGRIMPFDEFLSALSLNLSPLMMIDHNLGNTTFYQLLDGYDYDQERAARIHRRMAACVERLSTANVNTFQQKKFMVDALQRIVPDASLDELLRNASKHDLDDRHKDHPWFDLLREALFNDRTSGDPLDSCTKVATMLFQAVPLADACRIIQGDQKTRERKLFYPAEILRDLPPSLEKDRLEIIAVVERCRGR